MDHGHSHSHQEPHGPGFVQKSSVESPGSGVYSYNSSSVTGLPSAGTSARFLRYVPNKKTSTGQVHVDINDKDIQEQEQNLRLRGSQEASSKPLSSIIKPFPKRTSKLINVVRKELKTILAEKQGWKIFWLFLLNLVLTFTLFVYSGSTNSLALMAFSYLTIFDLLSLATCLLSLWVSLQKPTTSFSYGFERYEVLAVFSSTMLTMFGALFIFKESIERLLMPAEVATDNLFVLAVTGLFLHLLVTFMAGNKPLNEVSKAATSNWLQDAVTDLGHRFPFIGYCIHYTPTQPILVYSLVSIYICTLCICGIFPFLGKALIQRFNPIALLGIAGAACVLITDACIDYNKTYTSDSLCAIVMTTVIWATMLPLSIYSGQVLLQTCPTDIMSQIDKCLREASTLDGVLEFRNEHFWTVSFGKMAGSLHVRIRRDANEQMVLAHVTNKLSPYVTYLTVQVFKDDWIRSTSGTKLATLPASFPRAPSLPKIPHSHSHSHNMENSYTVNMNSIGAGYPGKLGTGKIPQKYAASPLATPYVPPSKLH